MDHYTCLRTLGLVDDPFTKLDGSWKNYFLSDAESLSGSSDSMRLNDSGSVSDVSTGSASSGSGYYGDVVLVRQNGLPFALKLFREKLSSKDKERISYVLHLQENNHSVWPKTLVRYLEAYQFGKGSTAVLMNRVSGISIEQMIQAKRKVNNLDQMAAWFCDIMKALEFLHRSNIAVAHRDVHDGNIMISLDGKRATLIDLDLACNTKVKECESLCYDKASPKSTPPDLWCSPSYLNRKVEEAQWCAGDLWGAASAFVSLITLQSGYVAYALPYTKHDRGTAECIFAFDDPDLSKVHNIVRLQTSNKRKFGDVIVGQLQTNWQARTKAKAALQILSSNANMSRDFFTMPLSQSEYLSAIERGEIELSGGYAD